MTFWSLKPHIEKSLTGSMANKNFIIPSTCGFVDQFKED
jgi:hypothetical protein